MKNNTFKAIKILLDFVEELSEEDCAYPDSPCLSIHISTLKHGVCLRCKAKMILDEARKQMKAEDQPWSSKG